MLAHILGFLVIASYVPLCGWILRTAFTCRRAVDPWMRPVEVPRVVEASLALSSGADYVGFV